MTKNEVLRSDTEGDRLGPDSMFGLEPGYFTAEDMVRAFNIPFGDDGPIPAVKEWVGRHLEYDLVEPLPGKWVPAY